MMENYEDQSWKTIYLGFFKKFLERNIYTHTQTKVPSPKICSPRDES